MRNVTYRRFGYVCALGLAFAGLLLISDSRPANSDGTHATASIGRGLDEHGYGHRTWWKCDSSDCKLTVDSDFLDKGDEHVNPCPELDDCGHSSGGHAGTWEYLGHQDHYTVGWSCDDPNQTKTDGTQSVWWPKEYQKGALPELKSTDIPRRNRTLQDYRYYDCAYYYGCAFHNNDYCAACAYVGGFQPVGNRMRRPGLHGHVDRNIRVGVVKCPSGFRVCEQPGKGLRTAVGQQPVS